MFTGILRRTYASASGIKERPTHICRNTIHISLSDNPRPWSSHGGLPPDNSDWKAILSYHEKEDRIVVGDDATDIFSYRRYFDEPDNKIKPELLYSIPQASWDEFLTRFSDSCLVKILNLSKYRHLCLGYNYVRSADTQDLRIKRASLISNHHFLLQIALSRPGSFRGRPSPIEVLKRDLDNGEFNMQLLAEFHPGMTYDFQKKVNRCPSFGQVYELANHIVGYAKMRKTNSAETPIDIKRLSVAINRMPSSISDPNTFDNMMKYIYKSGYLEEMIYSRILFNGKTKLSSEDFGHFIDKLNLRWIEEYYNALFSDLILRYIAQKCTSQKIPPPNENMIRQLYLYFYEHFIDQHSIFLINALQERWYSNLPLLEQSKPPIKLETWEPIIADGSLGEFTYTVLTSNFALREHGKEMHHSAGAYTAACLRNESNIIVLKDDVGTKSTLVIGYDSNNNPVINQHFATKHNQPLICHLEAADQLLYQMQTGKITLNIRTRHESTLIASSGYPYPPEDLDTQAIIYATYVRLGLLPPSFIAENYSAMLEKTGIAKQVSQTVMHHRGFSLFQPPKRFLCDELSASVLNPPQ